MNIRENSCFGIWNSLSNVVSNLLHAVDDKSLTKLNHKAGDKCTPILVSQIP